MKKYIVVTLLLSLTLIFAACAAPATPEPTAVPAPTEAPMPEMMNIVETAVAAGSFNTLVAAVSAAGLADTLAGEGPFTVFAPTDDAFAALPDGTIDALLADPSGDLTQILLYHVLSGKVMAEAVTDGLEVETLQGSMVKFSIVDGKPMINDAMIVTTDIEASNGVIHVIDAVILPPAEEEAAMPEMNIVETAVAAGGFDTLVAAVTAANLVDALSGEGPFTVFAPTDDAFAALPEGTIDALLADPSGDLTQILLYHVLSGKVMAEAVADGLEVETLQGSNVMFSIVDGKPMINGATIIATDIEASNGVIHVIDAVILPPAEEEAAMPEMNIVETAVAAGGFDTLVAAVTAANLVDALSGEGPFTVFAPTDEAFAALPAGTIDALLADPSGDLTQILLYHVLSGKVMAEAVADGLEVETLQGSNVMFSIVDGKPMINGATIIATDIEASNGVIHVIDAVITPPAE